MTIFYHNFLVLFQLNWHGTTTILIRFRSEEKWDVFGGLIFKPHYYVPGLFGKVKLMVILTFQIPFCAQCRVGKD